MGKESRCFPLTRWASRSSIYPSIYFFSFGYFYKGTLSEQRRNFGGKYLSHHPDACSIKKISSPIKMHWKQICSRKVLQKHPLTCIGLLMKGQLGAGGTGVGALWRMTWASIAVMLLLSLVSEQIACHFQPRFSSGWQRDNKKTSPVLLKLF